MRSVARRQGDEAIVDGATVTAHVDIGAIGGAAGRPVPISALAGRRRM
jgi:hypothetical protein